MKLYALMTVGLMACATSMAARAEQWVDYAPTKEPWTITTVKVEPGKLDDYIVSLKGTVANFLEMEKKNGDVLDYHILVNINDSAAGANVVFLTKLKDWSEIAPNKERELKILQEFRKAYTKEAESKIQDDRSKFRTFLDQGIFEDITYLK